jgi:hypothetical protein
MGTIATPAAIISAVAVACTPNPAAGKPVAINRRQHRLC